MRKLFSVSLIVMLAVTFTVVNVYAGPSAKSTAQCGPISMAEEGAGYTSIFTQTIKIPEKKDLFIDVSLECGLTTDTKVMSRQRRKAVAEAEATVMVRVIMDGDVDNPVAPGEITFARRHQTLIAEFAGDFSDCITDEGTIVLTETCVAEETLQLILDTMNANSFNFIASDVPVGIHEIDVQAKLEYKTVEGTIEGVGGEAAANAYLGKGSVTVECVRMMSGEDVTEF